MNPLEKISSISSWNMSSLTSQAMITEIFSVPNTILGFSSCQLPAAPDIEGAPKHRCQPFTPNSKDQILRREK